MATFADLMTSTPDAGPIRAFDVRRDLNRVADLVEQCFTDTLDRDGERYLQQMRSAALNPSYLHWASLVAERASMPLTGYVWEENGKLVGNLTLIPYFSLGRRYYLIANVAVHQDYRRHGVANRLTTKAIEHARQRGAQAIWLHVREENKSAIDLYQSAEFVERTRRTTWHSDNQTQSDILFRNKGKLKESTQETVSVGARRASHWAMQRAWFSRLYPPELSWHLSLNINALRPGLRGFLQRTLNDVHIQQWSALLEKRLIGVLAWQASRSYADNLWIATGDYFEDRAIETLLLHARLHLTTRRPLSLDYPAGRATDAIHAAGFHPHQTLIWMSLELKAG